ncbi:(deoxy)nucleoside triphosphate pyrophosphohydrolase [Vibrio alginolyticus]|uniref:(deoxy)nucleoside triphosphate pyrophosphohydrolase n=1 Tax=Vibrio alginolyticus TaxID=663 RepID=UPI003754DDD4
MQKASLRLIQHITSIWKTSVTTGSLTATIKVACGIIFNDEDEVFLCRRNHEKSIGGYWEFPGGKVEEGESYDECLKRELLEELDMDVRVKDHFITVQHDYRTFETGLIAFICHFQTSSFALMDHDRY